MTKNENNNSDSDNNLSIIVIPEPTCYHCKKSVKTPYLCTKCGIHYHPRCANKAIVLSNGAVRSCCDYKYTSRITRLRPGEDKVN